MTMCGKRRLESPMMPHYNVITLHYIILSIITVAYVHIIVALKSSICMSSFDKMTTFDIPILIKYCHAKYLDTLLY